MNINQAMFDQLMIELHKAKDADDATNKLVDLFELHRSAVKDHFVNCDGDGTEFHRGFRLYNVLPTAQEDIAAWEGIHNSGVFWGCFNVAKLIIHILECIT